MSNMACSLPGCHLQTLQRSCRRHVLFGACMYFSMISQECGDSVTHPIRNWVLASAHGLRNGERMSHLPEMGKVRMYLQRATNHHVERGVRCPCNSMPSMVRARCPYNKMLSVVRCPYHNSLQLSDVHTTVRLQRTDVDAIMGQHVRCPCITHLHHPCW